LLTKVALLTIGAAVVYEDEKAWRLALTSWWLGCCMMWHLQALAVSLEISAAGWAFECNRAAMQICLVESNEY